MRFAQILILTGFFSFFAQAQSPKPWNEQSREIQSAVRIQAQIEENQLHSDLKGRTEGSVKIAIQLESMAQFHVYEERLKFKTEKDSWAGAEWKIEVTTAPDAVSFLDPITRSLKRGFTGQSLFELKATLMHPVNQAYPPGHLLPLVVLMQSCNEKVCLFPAAIQVPLPLSVAPNSITSTAPSKWAKLGLNMKKTSALNLQSLSLSTLLLLLLAGIVTAFTPCVYPLYPVTLGIFSRWSNKFHSRPFALVLSYCAGLTLSYAFLGLASALGGFVFGSVTQKPTYLIAVGFIILLSALAFSGFIPFKLPAFLERYFLKSDESNLESEVQKSHGWALYAKSFLMGSGLGVVASPCVGPVLIAILSWLGTALAQGGAKGALQGFLYLAVFGLGMSLPFMVLGHMMIRMHKTPRLGRFTPYFKHVGTALMIVASLFFLIPGVQLLRIQYSPVKASMPLPALKLADWKKDQWTILDFRADWCGACLELEEKTFKSAKIRPQIEQKKWLYVSVDLTEDNAANQKLAQDFGVKGLPTVQIYSPQGKLCTESTLFGFEDDAEFSSRLENAQKDCH